MKFVKFVPYVILSLLALVGVYYVSLSSRNLIFMDFWRVASQLIPNVVDGNYDFSQYWIAELGHRNPLQHILFALDIKYFNLNCLWESYAGILVIVCSALLLIKKWNTVLNVLSTDNKYWIFALISFTFLPLFNLNQWEILSLQFSFCFMLRIFSYILIFYLLDTLLISKKLSFKNCFSLGVFVGIVVCLLSQLYWCAMVITAIFVLFLYYVLEKNSFLVKLKSFIYFIIPIVIFVYAYFYGMQKMTNVDNLGNFIKIIINGDIFIAISYGLSAIFVPQTVSELLPVNVINIIGITIGSFILLAIFLFFVLKIYRITYFPIALILYGLITIGILIYGRSGMFNIEYLSSSRYVCETTLIIVGTLFIYIFAIAKCILSDKSNDINYKVISYITLVLCLCISASFIYTYKTELRIAPYRGEYKNNLINYLNSVKIDVDKDFIVDSEIVSLLQSNVSVLFSYA